MTPDKLRAEGFVEGGADGPFFETDAAGRVTRFGTRQRDEDVYLKETVIHIDWTAGKAWRSNATKTGFPHPDADPASTLQNQLDDWLAEILASSRFVQTCSFCGKTSAEVARLIAGPTAMICNECVALCQEVLGEA